MKITNIIFKLDHITSPFTHKENNKQIQLSTKQKVAAIGLSLLIGAATAGIGGVIAFYIITAAMKNQLLNNSRPKVAFNEARVREFDKNKAPVEVANIYSFRKEKFDNSLTLKRTNSAPAFIDNLALQLFMPSKAAPYPSSVSQRRNPPISMHCDTIRVVDGKMKSVHCEGNERFFQDDEILKLHSSKRTIALSTSINADYTENNKIVIQQQAIRGCTAACAVMLVHDAEKQVDLTYLKATNVGNTDTMVSAIQRAGLNPLVTDIKEQTSDLALKTLRELVLKNGSAIIGTGHDIGGHVVIVDHISEDLKEIRLRDPFHGWEITVTKEGLLRGFSGGYIIQLVP